jgi:outer membrane protein assembly factor BamD
LIKILTLLLSTLLLISCSNKNKEVVVSDISDEEAVIAIYEDAIIALKKGDAFYAGKKFKEAESLLPQSEWAAKSSLMASYADYSRNSYSDSIFGLERHIKNYPADKNISYAHYLMAMCYYEQILDEKKDLRPLLQAKKNLSLY